MHTFPASPDILWRGKTMATQALVGADTGGLTDTATLRALAANRAPLKRDRSVPFGRAKPKLMSEMVFSHSVSPSGPATVTCAAEFEFQFKHNMLRAALCLV